MAPPAHYLTLTSLLWLSGGLILQFSPVYGQFCPQGWELRTDLRSTGSCLFFATPGSAGNWSEARQSCRDHSGFLIKIEANDNQLPAYPGILQRTERFGVWTGLHVHPQTGKLIWDGIRAVSLRTSDIISRPTTTWLDGQPDMTKGSCVLARVIQEIDQPPKIFYSLQNCSESHAFICEREPIRPVIEPVGCFTGWHGGVYTDYCYQGNLTAHNYADAQKACRTIKSGSSEARLVSPTTPIVEAYLSSLMINVLQIQGGLQEQGYWTGLRYNTSVGEFFWANGSRLDLSLPSSETATSSWSNGLNCGVIDPGIAGGPETRRPALFWRWENCSTYAAAVICELPKPRQSGVVPKFSLNTTATPVVHDGGSTVEIADFSALGFTIGNLLGGTRNVFIRNWQEVASTNISKEVELGDLQGFYWYNVWQLQPLLKISTNRILVIHSGFLSFRCQMDITKMFVLPTPAVNQFSLLGDLDQSLTMLQNYFREDLPVRVGRLTGWNNNVIFNLKRFSYKPANYSSSDKRLFIHFDVYVTLPKAARLEAVGLRNLTTAMQTVIRQSISEIPTASPADVDEVIASLEVLPTRKCIGQRDQSSVSLPQGVSGQVVPSEEMCQTAPATPKYTAHCTGDFYKGLKWKVDYNCEPTLSEQLDEIIKKDVNSDTAYGIAESVANISRNTTGLVPEVLAKITMILERIVALESVGIEAGGKVCVTIDNVMRVDQNMLMAAQESNSTSTRLLQTLDRYTERADLGRTSNQRQTYRTMAVEMWNVNPGTKVTGIRLLQSTPPSTGGDNYDYFTNSTLLTTSSDDDDDDDDDDIDGLDVSITLPPSLIQDRLNATQSTGGVLRMSFIVQRLDVLFQGHSSADSNRVVGGRIISATLGNEKIQNLSESQRITTAFFVNQTRNGTARCVFWDFSLDGGQGGWSGQGCVLLNTTAKEGFYECSCDHLTNFAVLIDYGNKIDDVNNTVLTVITIIGLSLSIIGLSLTVITFLLFRKLRAGMSQKTLFNLALALLIAWILFLVGIILSQGDLHNKEGCMAVAILLHFFLLAGFMWMLVEAFVQYLRFVKVLGTYIPYFIIKASLFAWGIPLIPVIVVLAIDYNKYYRHEGTNVTKFCWMDQYTSYFAFLIPVGLIIVVNAVVFGLIIWAICNRPKGLQTNQSRSKSMIISLQAGIACFVLLGLTWIFGYLAIEDARLVFQYIFTILNSFHGFFIFLFFTLREKKVRQQWQGLCCKKKDRKKSYVSSEMYSSSNKQGSDDTTSNSTSQTVVSNNPRFKRLNSDGSSVKLDNGKENVSFINNGYKR